MKITLPSKNAKKTPKKITLKDFKTWNLALAAVYVLQAILILVLSSPSGFAVTTNFLTTDSVASKIAGQPIIASASHRLFSLNLAYVVALFFLIAAATHLIVATVYRTRYEAGLNKETNQSRWVNYSLSVSIMMVAIGLLSGVSDLGSLLMVFILIHTMGLMGLAMERYGKGKKIDWFTFRVGVLAGIVPWIVFALYVWGAGVYGSGGIPTFVYWIYASMFLFFTCFAVNLRLQYTKKGKWADYLYGERVYMILSLVATTALAWQLFAGVLR